MATQTIHHPPTGGSLIPDHISSPDCQCKPERTTQSKPRQSKQGHNVIVHYWHKNIEGDK